LAILSELLAVPGEGLAVLSEVSAVPREMLAVLSEVLAIPNGVLAIHSELFAVPGEGLAILNEVLAVPNGVLTILNEVLAVLNGVLTILNEVLRSPSLRGAARLPALERRPAAVGKRRTGRPPDEVRAQGGGGHMGRHPRGDPLESPHSPIPTPQFPFPPRPDHVSRPRLRSQDLPAR
jgi:hypothetical protein